MNIYVSSDKYFNFGVECILNHKIRETNIVYCCSLTGKGKGKKAEKKPDKNAEKKKQEKEKEMEVEEATQPPADELQPEPRPPSAKSRVTIDGKYIVPYIKPSDVEQVYQTCCMTHIGCLQVSP